MYLPQPLIFFLSYFPGTSKGSKAGHTRKSSQSTAGNSGQPPAKVMDDLCHYWVGNLLLYCTSITIRNQRAVLRTFWLKLVNMATMPRWHCLIRCDYSYFVTPALSISYCLPCTILQFICMLSIFFSRSEKLFTVKKCTIISFVVSYCLTKRLCHDKSWYTLCSLS